jgi:hypothetical protein
MTKVAWKNKQDEILRVRPGITEAQFVYNLSKAEYTREWGNQYRRPGAFARFLSVLFKLIPRIGPFRPLQFRVPPAAADAEFMRSFNATLTSYRQMLSEVRAGHPSLPNRNFDTGRPTSPGEYRLADRTYAQWLDRLARKDFAHLSPPLRRDLIAFYHDPDAPNTTRTCAREWRRILKNLERLKATTEP